MTGGGLVRKHQPIQRVLRTSRPERCSRRSIEMQRRSQPPSNGRSRGPSDWRLDMNVRSLFRATGLSGVVAAAFALCACGTAPPDEEQQVAAVTDQCGLTI